MICRTFYRKISNGSENYVTPQFQGKGSQQQTVTDSSTVTDTETQPSDFSLKRKNQRRHQHLPLNRYLDSKWKQYQKNHGDFLKGYLNICNKDIRSTIYLKGH